MIGFAGSTCWRITASVNGFVSVENVFSAVRVNYILPGNFFIMAEIGAVILAYLQINC
jgi:hypothetical protein